MSIDSTISKKYLIVIGLVIVVAIATLAYKYLPTSITKKLTQGETITLMGPEIAERVVKFLDTAAKPDGSFELNYKCKKDSQISLCVGAPIEGPPHAGQIILAFYRLYQKTGNQEYKARADKGIEYALKSCKETSLDYCEWNFFPLYVYYKDMKDNKYKEAMLSISEKLLAERPLADIVNNNYGPKLAMLYEITGDKKYLNKLEQVADYALASKIKSKLLYKVDDFEVRGGDFQIVWSIYLPAYKASSDKKYLLVAQTFFDKAKLSSHFKKFESKDEIAYLIKSVDSLLSLADIISGENKSPYRKEAHRIGEKLLNSLYDGPENKKFNGDNGFLQTPSATATENSKQTLTNGWLAQLYLRMDRAPFELKVIQ